MGEAVIMRRSNGGNEKWATPVSTGTVSGLSPRKVTFTNIVSKPKRFILILNQNKNYTDDRNNRTTCLYWDSKQAFYGSVEDGSSSSGSMGRSDFLTYSNVIVEYDSSTKQLSINTTTLNFWTGTNIYSLYYSY